MYTFCAFGWFETRDGLQFSIASSSVEIDLRTSTVCVCKAEFLMVEPGIYSTLLDSDLLDSFWLNFMDHVKNPVAQTESWFYFAPTAPRAPAATQNVFPIFGDRW